MDPKQYFQEGGKGFIVTNQALDTIARAESSGIITPDQAIQQRRDLEAAARNLKASGGKSYGGFETQVSLINNLVPKIDEFTSKKKEVVNLGGQIEASKNLLKTYGVELSPEQVSAIDLAIQNNNAPELKAFNSALAARAAASIAEQIPATKSEQAKIDIDTQNLAIAKAKAEADKKEIENAKYSIEETLKDKYKSIMEVKKDPDIETAFGVPILRLAPGTDYSALSAKVGRLANKEWIDSIIQSKAAGATFGSLTEREGQKLASAATLLSDPVALDYEAANDELLRMAESVKKLYRKATGREIQEDLKLASPTPPDEMTPQQKVDAKAAELSGVLSGAPAQ
jgi:hypothetical protein